MARQAAITQYPKYVDLGEQIAKLTRAYKVHQCIKCKSVIIPGEFYYQILVKDGGICFTKFPERMHTWCLNGRDCATET